MSWFNIPSFPFRGVIRPQSTMTAYEQFVDDLKIGGYTVISMDTHYKGNPTDPIKVMLYHADGSDIPIDTPGLTPKEVLELRPNKVELTDGSTGIQTKLVPKDYDGMLKYLLYI
jgi:hypothetical protein